MVKQTFPLSQSKRASKSYTKHVFGIELAGASSDAMLSLKSERARNAELMEKVCILKARLLELEKSSLSMYGHKVDEVLKKGSFVTQGPDTVDKFANFSLDVIISELQQYAPDLFSHFMELGETPSKIGAQRGSKDIRATVISTVLSPGSSFQ